MLKNSHLTFGEIADRWAREGAAMPDGLARDKILHELLRAVWRGEFEDEDGNTVLMIHQPPPGGARRIDGKFVDKNHMRTAETKPVGFNRRMLLCALASDRPQGLPLPPGDRIRGWHSPESDNPEPVSWSELKSEVRWDILDALTLDEYGTFLAYLEALTISKDDFGQWCDEQAEKRPRFWFDDGRQVERGRPPRSTAASSKRSAEPNLTGDSRRKGGSRPKYYAGLQQFIDQLFIKFKKKGIPLIYPDLKTWLEANAPYEKGYQPEPHIPDCDDIEFYDDKVWWIDRNGQTKSVVIRSLERYIQRAREPAPTEPT